MKPLFDHSGADGGILREQIGDGGFEGVELAGLGTRDRGLVRSLEIFLDGAPAHAQIAFDLADRPAFRVIELVQGLNLFLGQHRPLSFFRPKPLPDQRDVVCKMPLRRVVCEPILAG